MQEQICLVTGATSGIGRVTARALAERGATTVLIARSAARAEATVAAIRQQTGNDRIAYLLADLSSQAQVRQVAHEFTQRYGRLDVLVNNAGALFVHRHDTEDGLEMTFALNHLAPFLLTNLLLDTLRASGSARVVTVASAAHLGAQIPFDSLGHPVRYGSFRAYSQSKLANILFTYELARRLQGTSITANTLHPGVVRTNFAKGDSAVARLVMTAFSPFTISPEKGAQTSIYLATSPEVAGVTGQYFAKCKPVRSSAASYDAAAARLLWQASEALVGIPVTSS